MKKKTLVLGASMNPARYSYLAMKSLAARGIPTVGIGLKAGEVEGVQISKGTVPFDDIHTITLYLNSQRQIQYYNYILDLQPERVIFNPGTENPDLYTLLKKEHVEIAVACTLIMLSTDQY